MYSRYSMPEFKSVRLAPSDTRLVSYSGCSTTTTFLDSRPVYYISVTLQSARVLWAGLNPLVRHRNTTSDPWKAE